MLCQELSLLRAAMWAGHRRDKQLVLGFALLYVSVQQNCNVKQFSGAATGQVFCFQPALCFSVCSGWLHLVALGDPRAAGTAGGSFSVVASSRVFSKLAVCPAQTVLIRLPRSVLLSDNQHQTGSDRSQPFTSHTGHF